MASEADGGGRGSEVEVEVERTRFRRLLLANPNYFGTAPELGFEPVMSKLLDTAYEELSCVAYSPLLDRIEATFVVKRSVGYSGGLCEAGSHEYVRFYVDYGSGWEDAGITAVNVHDLAVGTDCHKEETHPLSYVCGVDHKPRRDWCGRPVLPRLRAILSWEQVPPANQPDWSGTWGDRLECHGAVRPRRIFLPDVAEHLPGLQKLPSIAFEKAVPDPEPDPEPLAALSLGEVAELYRDADVPAHRFALPHVARSLAAPMLDVDQLQAAASAAKLAGISFEDVLGGMEDTTGETGYEELECVGLERRLNVDHLVATFRIKRSSGYSGPPCSPGSVEYVAFWADWGDECRFEYLGTVETRVHDYEEMPDGGICYAAILPVDPSQFRRGCKEPVLPRIRAVLSWATPPSTTDPDEVPIWGNRLDTHVQLAPGTPYDGTAQFTIVGGVPAAEVDSATGMTAPWAHLAVNGIPLDPRGCPFAGRVTLHGPTDPALAGTTYRVLLTNETQGVGPVPLTTGFKTVRWNGQTAPSPWTFWTPDSDGWIGWMHPSDNSTGVLGWFDTSGDDRWRIDLEVQGVGVVDSARVQLDNTLRGAGLPVDPNNTADLHLDVAGNCDVQAGTITGRFVARDLHFGSWGLSVHGGPSSGFPPPPPAVPTPALATEQQTSPAGHDFAYDLSQLPPCGYVVRLSVTDRAIVNSAWTGREVHVERGLCIRA